MASMWKEFSKGLWTEIPPFRVVLGLCPTLAVTRSAENGLGMGLAVIFVLVLSNILISDRLSSKFFFISSTEDSVSTTIASNSKISCEGAFVFFK